MNVLIVSCIYYQNLVTRHINSVFIVHLFAWWMLSVKMAPTLLMTWRGAEGNFPLGYNDTPMYQNATQG